MFKIFKILRSTILNKASGLSTCQLFKYLALIFFVYITFLLGFLNQFALNDLNSDINIQVNIEPKNQPYINKKIHLTQKKLAEQFNKAQCHLQLDSCFDIRQCSNRTHLKVFVYPDFSFGNHSRQFQEYIQTIYQSDYYEPDPDRACIFVPDIDFLNEDRIKNKQATAEKLHSLKYWNNGRNHFILTMRFSQNRSYLDYQTAIVAATSFKSSTYRINFDLSIPMFSPSTTTTKAKKIFRIISAQANLNSTIKSSLSKLSVVFISSDLDSLRSGVFCLIVGMDGRALFDALKFGCVPILVGGEWILPFSDLLDWQDFSVQIRMFQIEAIKGIVSKISTNQVRRMQAGINFVFKKYFQSMKKITLGVLNALEGRIYPNTARKSDEFSRKKTFSQSPFVIPMTPVKELGYIAVIIAEENLNEVISRVQSVLLKCKHVKKIEIIWFGRSFEQTTKISWENFKNDATGVSIDVNIVEMRLKNISTIFYPFESVMSYEGVLLVRESAKLDHDRANWATRIEKGFKAWLKQPDKLVSLSRSGSWFDLIGFYHSIYNRIFIDQIGMPNVSFNEQVDQMLKIIGRKDSVVFI